MKMAQDIVEVLDRQDAQRARVAGDSNTHAANAAVYSTAHKVTAFSTL